jgi:hypothetical protein
MPTAHTGSCFCGAVEITVSGEPMAMGYCHCDDCRKWSATPVTAYMLWPPESVTITKGEDEVGSYCRTGSNHRKFCKQCGSNLMSHVPGANFTDVYPAVVPDIAFKPTMHVYYSKSVLRIADGLPKLRDFPAEMGGSGEFMPE